jgi:hypothetical protein
MKFEGYYLTLTNNNSINKYYNIDIINFNEEYIISYFINDIFHSNIEFKISSFQDVKTFNQEIIFFKINSFYSGHQFYIKDMYQIKNKHFFLLKKNPPKDLSLQSIRKHLIKYGLEELAI